MWLFGVLVPNVAMKAAGSAVSPAGLWLQLGSQPAASSFWQMLLATPARVCVGALDVKSQIVIVMPSPVRAGLACRLLAGLGRRFVGHWPVLAALCAGPPTFAPSRQAPPPNQRTVLSGKRVAGGI
jgi:hypothetical protein